MMLLASWMACAAPAPEAQETAEAPVTDTAPEGCVTDEDQYAQEGAVVLATCAGCHVAGGAAGGTPFVLVASGTAADNLPRLQTYVAGDPGAAERLRTKPTGRVAHGGGVRFDLLDPSYAVLDELVARAEAPGGCSHPGTPAMVCDGTVRPGSAPLRRLNARQYVATVRALLNVDVDGTIFPATTEAKGFRTWADLNLVSAAGAEQVELAAEAASAALDVPALLACSAGVDERDCARAFLLDLYARGFRRPLEPAERALATRFLDAGLPVDAAVRMEVELLLQLPQFLYLDVSVDPAQTDPAHVTPSDGGREVAPLAADALAARLAYYLADAPPDATLREAAALGELATADGVLTHARRLADAPTALGPVAAFHRDWLRTWRLSTIVRDPSVWEGDTSALVTSALTELDLFTTEVVWSGNPTLDTLLFGTTGWVDPLLADLYGLPVTGPGWQLADAGEARPGVLTRSAFLLGHAHNGASAPVLRGAWVAEQMFCEHLTPPVNVNTTLPETSEEMPTIRERLAGHAADPACASCHERIDPAGLAFEHYDAMGRWRDRWESGIAVDASGSLSDPPGDFDGAPELLGLLSTSERAQACYVQRWFEYAVGRPAEDADACDLRRLTNRFAASGGNLRQLAVDVTLTDAFRYAPLPEEAP